MKWAARARLSTAPVSVVGCTSVAWPSGRFRPFRSLQRRAQHRAVDSYHHQWLMGLFTRDKVCTPKAASRRPRHLLSSAHVSFLTSVLSAPDRRPTLSSKQSACLCMCTRCRRHSMPSTNLALLGLVRFPPRRLLQGRAHLCRAAALRPGMWCASVYKLLPWGLEKVQSGAWQSVGGWGGLQ